MSVGLSENQGEVGIFLWDVRYLTVSATRTPSILGFRTGMWSGGDRGVRVELVNSNESSGWFE